MNTAVMEGLPNLMTQLPHLTVTHQTGESDHARVAEAYRRAGIESQVVPFIYDMPAALRRGGSRGGESRGYDGGGTHGLRKAGDPHSAAVRHLRPPDKKC